MSENITQNVDNVDNTHKKHNPIENRIGALRKLYEGKEIALTGSQLIWRYGVLELNVLSNNTSLKVPKKLQPGELSAIHVAINQGIIDLVENRPELKDQFKNVKITNATDYGVVSEMSLIDEILHKSIKGAEKQLESLKSKGTNVEFFKRLYDEEDSLYKREDFQKLIKTFM
ncbi:MAG: hypothetical protein B7C24_13900 [Bacteroidetes bacterium 4572_77]|nr:MAG: hypothetical protein B7C24_13900 [Bacteroidetes bacterium 4572_77]